MKVFVNGTVGMVVSGVDNKKEANALLYDKLSKTDGFDEGNFKMLVAKATKEVRLDKPRVTHVA